jgi:23S rRNA (adenine1618-N6)-methyltransferase
MTPPIPSDKKPHATEKTRLHPRNRHRDRYDFCALTSVHSDLAGFVTPNRYGDDSIDFADPKAVRCLNTAILKQYYDITSWDLPEGYLCPPIPGRADYIHHIGTLLSQLNYGKIPTGAAINCLDIGVGASCIYPIIGIKEYDWRYIGTEIDEVAIKAAQHVVDANDILKDKVTLRHNADPKNIFNNIIQDDEFFDLTICNPPFHASLAEAQEGSNRKITNLKLDKKEKTPTLNFGGQQTELWCEGGEEMFIQSMVQQSKAYKKQVLWFSTLVSKQSNVRKAEAMIHRVDAAIKVIPMGQGNKSSRIIAWTFKTPMQQKEWAKSRWV